MPFPIALFQLGFALIIWAIFCCAIYGALRWLHFKIPAFISVFGFLTLVFQTLGLGLFALLLGYDDGDFPEIERAPYPLALLVAVVSSWFGTGILGAVLVRAATKKRMTWWQSLLFGAFFLAIAHGSWFWFSNGFDLWQMLSKSANIVENGLGFTRRNENWSFVLGVLWWIFPLGAPLAERVWNRVRATLKNPFISTASEIRDNSHPS